MFRVLCDCKITIKMLNYIETESENGNFLYGRIGKYPLQSLHTSTTVPCDLCLHGKGVWLLSII